MGIQYNYDGAIYVIDSDMKDIIVEEKNELMQNIFFFWNILNFRFA